MPKKRLTMRQIRELLRLKYGDSKLSDRAIAIQLGVARSTIQDYLMRVVGAGLTWPLPYDQRWRRSLGQIGGPIKLSPGSFHAAWGMADTVSGACPGDGVGAI